MKFLWKMRTRSHHLRGCSTPCQLEPTLSSPVGMLQRATCNLFIRVSGGNAGRPASQLCFCNIAIWCWHHSASQTPQGSGKNLTPLLQYALFFFVSNGFGFVCLGFFPGVQQFGGWKGCAALWSVLLPLHSKALPGEARQGSSSALQGGKHDGLGCSAPGYCHQQGGKQHQHPFTGRYQLCLTIPGTVRDSLSIYLISSSAIYWGMWPLQFKTRFINLKQIINYYK